MGKLTEAEKLARQMARKADGMNKRALRDVGGLGSLFAAEAPTYSAEDAYWLWRRQKATMVEMMVCNLAVRRMEWVRLGAVEHLAGQLLGAEAAAEAGRRIRATFDGKPDYMVGRWRSLLVRGEGVTRLELRTSPEWVNQYNRDGRRVFDVDPIPADGRPRMMAEEFSQRFPPIWRDVAQGDDDPTGLFPRVMAALGG